MPSQNRGIQRPVLGARLLFRLVLPSLAASIAIPRQDVGCCQKVYDVLTLSICAMRAILPMLLATTVSDWPILDKRVTFRKSTVGACQLYAPAIHGGGS